MTMSKPSIFKEENSYLALRDAKIARNNARLQELGLTSNKQRTKRDTGTLQNVHPRTSPKKSKSNTTEESSPRTVVEPQRRSLRIQTLVVDHDAEYISSPVQPRKKPLTVEQLTELNDLDVPPISRKESNFAKNSAREIQLDVEQLLFGSLNEGDCVGLLGIQLQTTGKAFVIEESSRRAVHKEIKAPISFNKYCGAQEWGNNVIYLWINFGSPGSDVVNKFDSNGRQVNWYGGSKMHDGTPLIQKLKRLGVQSTQKSNDSIGAVLLWCRSYNMTKKGFDPYVCFGRLSLISYDPATQPVQFIWNLIDLEKIVHHESKKVHETFQKFMAFK